MKTIKLITTVLTGELSISENDSKEIMSDLDASQEIDALAREILREGDAIERGVSGKQITITRANGERVFLRAYDMSEAAEKSYRYTAHIKRKRGEKAIETLNIYDEYTEDDLPDFYVIARGLAAFLDMDDARESLGWGMNCKVKIWREDSDGDTEYFGVDMIR